METLASEEHKHHPLCQSRVPENHRGRGTHLQKQLTGLRLS